MTGIQLRHRQLLLFVGLGREEHPRNVNICHGNVGALFKAEAIPGHTCIHTYMPTYWKMKKREDPSHRSHKGNFEFDESQTK